MARLILFFTFGFLAMANPAMAAAISGVSVEAGEGGVERVVFETNAAISVNKKFVLPNPDRVVVDIPSARATGIVLPKNYAGNLLGAIRFGQFDPATSRLVIEVKTPVRILAAKADGDHRLVVEVQPLTPVAAAPAKPVASTAVPSAATSPFAQLEPPAAPNVKENKKPLIILDPGHGGQDPGALGIHETREKNVTLAIARAVREGLLRTGRYRVILTRDNDTYIPLQGRVDIARRAKADVFISMHADSNPRPDARGLSIYTLSETASDDEAGALAERENKSDIIAGLDLNTADEDVASILIDLTQRETMNKSAVLADTLVENLHPKINKLPSTHRFAGFRVLKAPDVPSVLIEMGFLSNSSDEQLLQSQEYQGLLVASVIKGLDVYTKE